MFESSVMVTARTRWMSVTVHLDVLSYSAGGRPLVDVLSYSSAVGCPQLQLTVQVDIPRWMSSVIVVQLDVLSYSKGGHPQVDVRSYSAGGCPQLQCRWTSPGGCLQLQ